MSRRQTQGARILQGFVSGRWRRLPWTPVPLAFAIAVLGVWSAAAVAREYTSTAVSNLSTLEAFQPAQDGQSYEVDASVGCGTTEDIQLQTCARVHNADGNWYTVTGSCVPNDSTPRDFGTTNYTGVYGKWELGVCGHTYLSRGFARTSDNPSGVYGASQDENQCS